MASAAQLLRKDYRRLFLALVLVKSKPQEVNASEFLRQIQGHIKKGSVPDGSESSSYIDAVSYWKTKALELEEQNAILKSHLAKLETEGSVLANHSDSELNTPHEANCQRKRKRNGLAIFADLENKNKRKRTLNEDVNQPLEGIGLKVTTYLNHIYGLQKVLTQSKPTQKDLAVSIVELCADAHSILQHGQHIDMSDRTPVVITSKLPPLAKDLENVPIQLIKKVCVYILDALRAYVSAPGTESLDGQVTYACVTLFNAFLKDIQRHSEVDNKKRPPKSYVSKEVANQRRGRSSRIPPVKLPTDTDTTKRLVNLAVWFFANLDVNVPVQKSIVDGCLHYLLSRTGFLLQAFVFSCGCHDKIHPTTECPENCNADAYSLFTAEAPAIVTILRKVFSAYRNFHLSAVDKLLVSTSAAPDNPKLDQSIGLSEGAHLKLQSTLLKAVFDEDPITFEDRLLEPEEPLEDLDPSPNIGLSNTAEWFKQQVWTIVGWNMLHDHVDFFPC